MDALDLKINAGAVPWGRSNGFEWLIPTLRSGGGSKMIPSLIRKKTMNAQDNNLINKNHILFWNTRYSHESRTLVTNHFFERNANERVQNASLITKKTKKWRNTKDGHGPLDLDV